MSKGTKKSGVGNSHGVISEVSAYMTVKPGHEEEARAAAGRFGEMLRNSAWEATEDRSAGRAVGEFR